MKCVLVIFLIATFNGIVVNGSVETCAFKTEEDSLLQCLEVGQGKYTIRKCEAGTNDYENGSQLAFHCLKGGQLQGDLVHKCLDGKWDLETVPGCQKTCPELLFNPIKTNVTCNGCQCKGPQIIGTHIHISCLSDYEEPKSIKHTEFECLENGTWSAPIYDCIKVHVDVKNVLPLNTGGMETHINKVPYHAGIYVKGTKKPFQRCGSTIISQRVVVSAAHCFYYNYERQPISKYLIVAGKFHRDYTSVDPNTQESGVSEVYIHDSYKDQDLFRDDLALVILESPFTFTPVVQKVHVDLDFNQFTFGRVSGWGKDENQKVLKTLHTVQLDVVDCVQDNLTEKFCAGGKGATVCPGDSGGGFISERDGVQYVVGVVSTSSEKFEFDCNPNSPARFNRLAPYLNLFQKAKRYLLLFETCEDYKFKCNSGKCINYEQVCDGTIDCDQDGLKDDEMLTNCNLFPIQKMLNLGNELLVASKFYENRYTNWVIPTGALWIMANFLSQTVTNETIQHRIARDFGISVLDKGDDMLRSIQNASIYQSEFLYTKGEIQIVNDTLAKKYLGNIKARRKGPPEFFYPELYRIGVHLNADYSYLVKEPPVNITFVMSNNESVHVPMVCFSNRKTEVSFIKELDADVSSIPLTDGKNLKLYVIEPKSNMDISLQALKAYNMRLIEERLFGNTKDVCLPEFKIITSVDYSPVLYKLGYDYIFNLDPIEMSIVDRPAHFQTNIRGFFGVSEEENYQRPKTPSVVNIDQSHIINKPFIFIVTEEVTNAVLFMGKVLEPQRYSRYANAYTKCKIFSEKQCN